MPQPIYFSLKSGQVGVCMEGEDEEGLFVGETAKRSVHKYYSHYERHPFSSNLMHRLYWFGRGLTWGAVHSIEAMFKVPPIRPPIFVFSSSLS